MFFKTFAKMNPKSSAENFWYLQTMKWYEATQVYNDDTSIPLLRMSFLYNLRHHQCNESSIFASKGAKFLKSLNTPEIKGHYFSKIPQSDLKASNFSPRKPVNLKHKPHIPKVAKTHFQSFLPKSFMRSVIRTYLKSQLSSLSSALKKGWSSGFIQWVAGFVVKFT